MLTLIPLKGLYFIYNNVATLAMKTHSHAGGRVSLFAPRHAL